MNIEKQGIKTTITKGEFEVQAFMDNLGQSLYLVKDGKHTCLEGKELDAFLEEMVQLKARRDELKRK